MLILGTTGSLGRYVTQQAIAVNHERVVVHQADLAAKSVAGLATSLRATTPVSNTAGLVTEGQRFVDLIAAVVTGLESWRERSARCNWSTLAVLPGDPLLRIGHQVAK